MLFLIILLLPALASAESARIETELQIKEGNSWRINPKEVGCFDTVDKNCAGTYNAAETAEDIELVGDRSVVTALYGFYFVSKRLDGSVEVEVFTRVQAISKNSAKPDPLVFTESTYPVLLSPGQWQEINYSIGRKSRKLRFRALP